jgi:hypothetical protein
LVDGFRGLGIRKRAGPIEIFAQGPKKGVKEARRLSWTAVERMPKTSSKVAVFYHPFTDISVHLI